MVSLDKIKGCFLLGACGDALGAPLEGIKDLDSIIAAHGEKGLGDLVEFKNAYDRGIDFPPGRITDDTTMTMVTAAAMVKARDPLDWDEMRGLLWQGYLSWGQHQEGGEELAAKIDAAVEWPQSAQDFMFYCGAGRGTIAALMQEKPGSIAEPLDYDCVIRGRETKGPNAGCGGMMRVAPLALLDLPAEKIFELGCESAALTHGHADAYVATGAVALLTHFAAQDMDMQDVVRKTQEVLREFETLPAYKSGVATALRALDHAAAQAASKPGDLHVMDALPRDLGYSNAFLAVPVLAQSAYALLSADSKPDAAGIRSAMAVAVSHSGDSDSVGAIVGNVLGARHGTGVIPKDWLDILLQKRDVEGMAEALHAKTAPTQDKTPAPPKARPRL